MTPKQTTPFVSLFSVPACPARNVPVERSRAGIHTWELELLLLPWGSHKGRVSSDQCQSRGARKGPEPFPFHCAAPEESCVCSRWAGWDLGGVVSLFWGFGFFCGFFMFWGILFLLWFLFVFVLGFVRVFFKYPLCICFYPQKGEEFCKST